VSERERARENDFACALAGFCFWGGNANPLTKKKIKNTKTHIHKPKKGDRDVWDYWFSHFAPQYEGLPGLGSVEALYSQPDDEEQQERGGTSGGSSSGSGEAGAGRAAKQQQGSSAVAAAREVQQQQQQQQQPAVDSLGRARAKGGRKTSAARVILWRGQGRVLVNRRPLDEHFVDMLHRSALLKPLAVTGLTGKVDVLVQVSGGGLSGQAQAAAHGIARALRRLDPSLRGALKEAGLLRRDPRMVERKKPGRAKARKRFAWVKR
jgi:ribosomal protein S9